MTTRQFILCSLAVFAWVAACVTLGFLIAELIR